MAHNDLTVWDNISRRRRLSRRYDIWCVKRRLKTFFLSEWSLYRLYARYYDDARRHFCVYLIGNWIDLDETWQTNEVGYKNFGGVVPGASVKWAKTIIFSWQIHDLLLLYRFSQTWHERVNPCPGESYRSWIWNFSVKGSFFQNSELRSILDRPTLFARPLNQKMFLGDHVYSIRQRTCQAGAFLGELFR